MIKGLTHDEYGELNKIVKYRGKISAGFAPGEGPNKKNYPVACGFFRFLKEVVTVKRLGASQKTANIKEWILNEPVQQALEKSQTNPNKMPRRIEIVSLYKTIMEMWESSLAMYSGNEGLMCKSHGQGTNAKYLTFGPDGERIWINREFDGKEGCIYKDCPDFRDGKCKPIGLMKCFPVVDMAPNPYRFETRSINTIMGIESSLHDMWTLLQAAHAVKQMEAKKPLPFDGFFGAKLQMVHRKTKSGGREIYITDIMPTEEFTELVMEPIRRGLITRRKQAKMVGSEGSMSMLENAGQRLIESSQKDDVEIGVPMDLDDQKEIAVNFGANADKGDIPSITSPDDFKEEKEEEKVSGDAGKAAADALLEENKDDDKKEK